MTALEQIQNETDNYLKAKMFIDMGLHPQYGLGREYLWEMYKIYEDSTGDGQFNGRFSCGSCQMQVYERLKDLLNYNNNMGKPLINWNLPVVEIKNKKKHGN